MYCYKKYLMALTKVSGATPWSGIGSSGASCASLNWPYSILAKTQHTVDSTTLWHLKSWNSQLRLNYVLTYKYSEYLLILFFLKTFLWMKFNKKYLFFSTSFGESAKCTIIEITVLEQPQLVIVDVDWPRPLGRLLMTLSRWDNFYRVWTHWVTREGNRKINFCKIPSFNKKILYSWWEALAPWKQTKRLFVLRNTSNTVINPRFLTLSTST